MGRILKMCEWNAHKYYRADLMVPIHEIESRLERAIDGYFAHKKLNPDRINAIFNLKKTVNLISVI
jgi:hypothetical protein